MENDHDQPIYPDSDTPEHSKPEISCGQRAESDKAAGQTKPIQSSTSRSELEDLFIAMRALTYQVCNALPKQKKQTSWPNLNSPFSITVIGGAILALVTAFLQERATTLAAERDRITAHRSEEQRVLASFANDFPPALHRLYLVKQKWIWLRRYTLAAKDTRSSTATTVPSEEYLKTMSDYAQLNERYINNQLAGALAAEASGTFDSGSVRTSLSELIASSDQMFGADDDPMLERLHDQCNEIYDKTISQMCEELKK